MMKKNLLTHVFLFLLVSCTTNVAYASNNYRALVNVEEKVEALLNDSPEVDHVNGYGNRDESGKNGLRGGVRGGDTNADGDNTLDGVPEGGGGFVDATARSFAMIMVSELGDETFIIAAIMAMRHPRAVILAGALGALYVMTILSAALGFVMPKLISPSLTHNIATFMYFFFGCRLAYIGYKSGGEDEEDEMEEVENMLKSGQSKTGFRALLTKILTPTFVEAFILTFLAEWGDRSQIATITLAAHMDPFGVTLGAMVGHSICTSIAVFGGKLIAEKISQKTVAFAGSATFFVFAILNLVR